jgi:glucokinase
MSPAPQVSADKAVRPLFVGIDVGGTSIKFGLVDDEGQTLAASSIPTDASAGPEDATLRMHLEFGELLASIDTDPDEVIGVGLVTPGPIDIPNGIVLTPSNLPTWRHYPIRDRLVERVCKPVIFGNDANAAAFGEYWVGGGKAYPSIILLTLGTGIGAGIIIGDLSIDGEHSHGSECGHIIIDYKEDARLCTCGHRGHLEAYTSAWAITQRAEEMLVTPCSTSVRDRLKLGANLSPLILAQEAERGDGFAMDIIMEAATFLGIGIVSLVHTIDPGAVILGGAMNFGGADSEVGKKFLDRVHDEFRRRAFPVCAEKTVIAFAQLGGNAGYVGAAGLARSAHHQSVLTT